MNFPNAHTGLIEAMADKAETPAVALDKEGNIVWCSAVTVADLEKFFGTFEYSFPAMVMRVPANAAFGAFAGKALQTGRYEEFAGHFETVDGNKVYAVCRFEPMPDYDVVRASFDDVTELETLKRAHAANSRYKNIQLALASLAAIVGLGSHVYKMIT